MRLWRLSGADFAERFDGGYGLHHDGRWNLSGHPVTYCATGPALCVLERLVHIEDALLMPGDAMLVCYDVPDDVAVQYRHCARNKCQMVGATVQTRRSPSAPTGFKAPPPACSPFNRLWFPSGTQAIATCWSTTGTETPTESRSCGPNHSSSIPGCSHSEADLATRRLLGGDERQSSQ